MYRLTIVKEKKDKGSKLSWTTFYYSFLFDYLEWKRIKVLKITVYLQTFNNPYDECQEGFVIRGQINILTHYINLNIMTLLDDSDSTFVSINSNSVQFIIK